jgi:integrase
VLPVGPTDLAKRFLTEAAVKRVKPPKTGQVDMFDQGYPGLALRISYGGGKSWAYFYRMGGKLRRMTIGTYPAMSLADAREGWRTAREDVSKGRDPARVGKREKLATDFESVSRDWLRRDQADNRSRREVERIVNRELVPAWGHRPIAEIGRRDILDLIDGIADRGSVTMARRVYAYVHRLLRWAVGRGIIESNPAADLPKPGSETRRDRVLSDDELAAVWRGCGLIGWPFGNAIRLLILTGARREEIGGLRWSEINGTEIKLEGARTKSGDPHTIPLSPAAVTVLQQCPLIGNSDFVFSTNGRTPVSGWSRAKDRLDEIAKIEPWRIHDLRRTVATGLQKLGIGLQVVESILGHVSGSRAGVVGIYQRHTYDAEKRAALEAWGAHVIALVQ